MNEPTIIKAVTVDGMIEFLNQLLKVDRDAISALFATYVPCTQVAATPSIKHFPMADHPTVQVNCEGGKCEVSMLGILNGLFGVDEHKYGLITKVVDIPSGKIESFRRTKAESYQLKEK